MTNHLMKNDFDQAELPNVDHAKGVWIWDTEGKRYLDGSSGAVVSLIGHSHPSVIKAMTEQINRITFCHRGAFRSESLEELADKLTAFTGYAGAWFVGSGSEATESTIQLVLRYHALRGEPERQWFLSHRYGFHGSTLGSLSMSGHVRRQSMRDLAHVFNTLPTPYRYRDANEIPDEEYAARLLAGAREQFEQHAGKLAGVMVEPVGGATLGCTVPPDGYLEGLKALCEEFGALFIVDEVMTGMGRTGRPMAAEHWGIEPDIATMGKGLGAGYNAMAAVLLSQHVFDVLRTGTGTFAGGHTYAGNPLAAATGLAVLKVIESEDVVARGCKASVYLEQRLRALADRHPLVGDVRGIGMMWTLELVDDPITKKVNGPQGSLQVPAIAAAKEAGVLVYPVTGSINDGFIVAPPLIIENDEIDFLIAGLDAALSSVAAQRTGSSNPFHGSMEKRSTKEVA